MDPPGRHEVPTRNIQVATASAAVSVCASRADRTAQNGFCRAIGLLDAWTAEGVGDGPVTPGEAAARRILGRRDHTERMGGTFVRSSRPRERAVERSHVPSM